MKLMLMLAVLLFLVPHAYAYDYWNDIRHSALLPDSTVTIRAESIHGTGVENYALYNQGGVQEASMTHILDGPSTIAATVPGPHTDTLYYGFRTLQGDKVDLMPVRIPDATSPGPEDLTLIAPDSLGDEVYGYTNLDIVECRMSYSGDRLYGSIANAGGGFPVIQGLTFFGYTIGINRPGVADPDTVFGLMYTYEQAGIISPGLYMITGTGLGDLTKLGEIVVEEFPASNTLVISCRLSDLMSNPHFMSWYDPTDPVMDIAAFTQRITILGGPAEADRSPGGWCYPREFSIPAGANELPGLADFTLQGEGASAVAEITYSDADGNCPVVAEIVFDGGLPYPMYPETLDYTADVTYSTEPGIEPLANMSWTSAVVYFSDDMSDSVEYAAPGVGVYSEDDPRGIRGIWASVGPNPSRGYVTIEFTMPVPGTLCMGIYDIKGSLVQTLLERYVSAGSGSVRWRGTARAGSRVSPGIYFLKVSGLGQERSVKLVLLD
jgi:hypothetical protein